MLGHVGMKTAYLDVTVDEAVSRYNSNIEDPLEHACSLNAEVIEFEDEFNAYDIWRPGSWS